MNRFSALFSQTALRSTLLCGGCLLILLAALPVGLAADTITAPLAEQTPVEEQAAAISPADSPAGQVAEPLQQNPAMTAPRLQSPAAAAELLDIKEPIEITDNSQTIFLITAAILTGLVLLVLLFFWWKRSRKQQAVMAHETALLQLEQADQLIEQEQVNAFITLIDQTLRRYIEQRFAVSARRQTTREFITRLTGDREPVPQPLTDNSDNLKTWLEHCDLVKFARAGLNRETMKEMVTNLRSFIESTKIDPEQLKAAHKEAEK